MTQNVYDVTQWTVAGSPSTTAATDIGAVINSIIADIKAHQTAQSSKPGATIYIPPGEYRLRTRVVIDVSYLQITGSGHGFTSIAIRNGTSNTSGWFELNPGGSHITVENSDGHPEAFLIQRSGDPRLSSIELRDFCLDGVSYPAGNPSYANGKYGIRSTSATDSLRISGLGLMYLEHGLVIADADATSVMRNFIVECTNCIELVGSGQASLVSNNHLGAGPTGFTIFAENHFGLLVRGNNIFPVGKSLVHLKNTSNSSVTGNRLQSIFSGAITFEGTCSKNLIVANDFHRQDSATPGPTDDLFGIIHLSGSDNTVVDNNVNVDVTAANLKPGGANITGILVASGSGNYIATNRFRSLTTVKVAVLDSSTSTTTILDSRDTGQFVAYSPATYSYRANP